MALVKTLHELAASGKTIITSIHQPSSGVFASFSRLLLLADGSVVYSGTPLGSLDYLRTQVPTLSRMQRPAPPSLRTTCLSLASLVLRSSEHAVCCARRAGRVFVGLDI